MTFKLKHFFISDSNIKSRFIFRLENNLAKTIKFLDKINKFYAK